MSDERGGPRTLACPSCGTEFVLGVPRCRACGLMLTGPLAARLWQIDTDLVTLTDRRAAALAALRDASRPSATADAMTQPYADLARPPAASSPSASLAEDASTAPTSPVGSGAAVRRVPSQEAGQDPYLPAGVTPPPPHATTQHVLLGVGVLLLVVAAVVFFAVTWDLLGVAGRMLALLLAIAICVGLAAYCAPRRLSASAEAFAILAVGLSVVGLSAAYALDLFGLGSTSVRGYAAGASAVLAIGAGALHPTARTVTTYPLVALGTAWFTPMTAFADDTLVGWAAAFAIGWVVLASPFLRWARRLADPGDSMLGSTRTVWAEHGAAGALAWAPLWPPAVVSGVLGLGAATVVIGIPGASASALSLAISVVVAGLAVAGHALRVDRKFDQLPRALVVPAVVFWVVVGVELAAFVRNAGVVACIVLTAVCAVLLVLLLSVRSGRTRSWSPHLGTVVAGAGTTAAALVILDGRAGASAFVLALVAAGASALAVAEPPWRPRAEAVGSAAGLAAVVCTLIAVGAGAVPATFTFLVAGVLLTVLTAVRRGVQTEEKVLGTATIVAFAAALVIAFEYAGPRLDAPGASAAGSVLAVAFAVAAFTALGYAVLPDRGWAIAAALPLAVAAVWTLLSDNDVNGLEAYTFTAALLCALAGAAVRLRVPDAGSWLVAGPALCFALLPSALLATSTESGLRVVYVLVAGTGLLLWGTSLRWRAMVTVPAIALGLVAVQELFLALVAMPPTLSFLIAGAVLVAAGVRYERNVRDLRNVGAWLERMT